MEKYLGFRQTLDGTAGDKQTVYFSFSISLLSGSMVEVPLPTGCCSVIWPRAESTNLAWCGVRELREISKWVNLNWWNSLKFQPCKDDRIDKRSCSISERWGGRRARSIHLYKVWKKMMRHPVLEWATPYPFRQTFLPSSRSNLSQITFLFTLSTIQRHSSSYKVIYTKKNKFFGDLLWC